MTNQGVHSIHPERSVLDKFVSTLSVSDPSSTRFPDICVPLRDMKANAYVPSWLRTIPTALYDIPLSPLPPPVDPSEAAQIFPQPLLEAVYPPMPAPFGLGLSPVVPAGTPFSQLKEDRLGYRQHFTNLLALEHDELRSAAGKQVMYGVKITQRSTKIPGPRSSGITWQMQIPGTREDSPRLFIDDRLRIRGLYRMLSTATEAGVQARITGTIKREGLVFFECPALESMDHMLRTSPHTDRQAEYMIEFYPSSDALFTMHNAVSPLPSTCSVDLVVVSLLYHSISVLKTWLNFIYCIHVIARLHIERPIPLASTSFILPRSSYR
jgi:hypothetical protein